MKNRARVISIVALIGFAASAAKAVLDGTMPTEGWTGMASGVLLNLSVLFGAKFDGVLKKLGLAK